MNMLKKMVLIRADKPEDMGERKDIVTHALEHNFLDIIVKEEDKKIFEKLGKFNVLEIENCKINGPDFNGVFVEITNSQDCQRAEGFADKYDIVVVLAEDWKIIPVENLIAQFQDLDAKLLVEIENAHEAKLFFETLEVGADGIVLSPKDPQDIIDLRKLIDETECDTFSLVPAKITKIKSLGSGDRVCIDCCSQMKEGEGMLVGSQSNCLFLVHSESVESEYVATRPFRVNAGSVHSYILTPDNKTRYLSELQAGDDVLVVNQNGKTRSAVLGRVKIEIRPLILLEVEHLGKRYNIILQNAETIRLVSEGEPKSITELKEGDFVMILTSDSARHFGMKVTENIIEK